MTRIPTTHIRTIPPTPRHIAPLPTADDGQTLLNDPSAASRAELKELVDSLSDTQPAGALVSGGSGSSRGVAGVRYTMLIYKDS